MKMKLFLITIVLTCSFNLFASKAMSHEETQREFVELQKQTHALQLQINQLKKQVTYQKKSASSSTVKTKPKVKRSNIPQSGGGTVQRRGRLVKTQPYHSSVVSVHTVETDPESVAFYPTALLADGHVVAYIAGTPIVTSPYLGSRPAFDGSDYIVNISSINRDVRLLQQRQRLYAVYEQIGYPTPEKPILAFSGKVEPLGYISSPEFGRYITGDFDLGSGELDAAAALNDKVEGYLALAYDASRPRWGAQRVANSALFLNMGFVNIGDLDDTPFYITAGQLYAPFGRYSTAMISAPLHMRLSRTRTRPVILGYKSQSGVGLFAALYGFKSDTTVGSAGAEGLNLGYIFGADNKTLELGVSFISTINDANGLQNNGAMPNTTFAGFASLTNGSEAVAKVPAVDLHANLNYDRYTLTAEWVSTMQSFRAQDLSFNGQGAALQAGQLEAGVTFMACDRPASVSVGYQWTTNALALNLARQRFSGVFNISIWKDTIESLEYRHDLDYKTSQYANGIAPPGVVNVLIVGTGKAANTLLAQIGVFF